MALEAKKRRTAKLSLQDLPEDLVIEILIRLPHHFAIRCMSVCKFWYSLISNTEFRCRFISLRSSTNKKQPRAFIGYPAYKPNPKLIFSTETVFQSRGFSFNFLPCDSSIRIVETFNDLVLCYDSKNLCKPEIYYICNPMTLQWTVLPPAPRPCQFLPKWQVCFICEPYYNEDPTDGNIALNTQHRFKVLRIYHDTHHRILLEIFSSEIGQWNEILLSVPENMALKFIHEAAACDNGKKLILLGPSTKQNQLVSVIVEGENFDEYHRVVVPIEHYHMYSVKLCKKNLRLAHVTTKWEPNLQIWELNEYREWKLVESISSFKEILSKDEFLAKDGLINFQSHDRDVLQLQIPFNGVIGLYDMRKGTLNLVPKTCWFEFSFIHPLVLPFWPTPVPQISQVTVHP